MHKKRKNIEIYFILYLSALLLLLPDKDLPVKEKKQIDNSVPFQLSMDKATLTCQLHKGVNGIEFIRLDSLNKIFWRGNVRNVTFEFIIEDLTQRQQVSLNKKNNDAKLFKIKEDEIEQKVEFFWNPKPNEYLSKTYLVKVVAKAISKENDLPLVVKTQFSLNLYFDDDVSTAQYTSSNQTLNPKDSAFIVNQQITQRSLSNNIALIPEEYIIKTLAFSKWQNIIRVTGLNLRTDLLKNPSLKLVNENNGGTCSIVDIKDDKIILQGIAPKQGQMLIQLQLVSKFTKQESSIEFKVKSSSIDNPIFEKNMYPLKEYKIISNFPDNLTQNAKTLIKNNKGEIITQAFGSNDIYLKVRDYDTNKIYFIERYLENEQIGERFQIYLRSYSNPDIISVELDKKKDNTLIVRTRSYGLTEKGKNLVKTIFLEEKAEVRELYGQSKSDSDTHYQVFEIKFQNLTKAKIQAIDSRSFVSPVFRYP